MPFPLGVGQVIPFIVVEGQAQFALVRAQVVAHKIGIFIQVDGLQSQLPQAFPAVGVGQRFRHLPATAKFGAIPVLEVDATGEGEEKVEGGMTVGGKEGGREGGREDKLRE
eukprot:evm.model.NODE_35542_length_20336_cov_24.742279.3